MIIDIIKYFFLGAVIGLFMFLILFQSNYFIESKWNPLASEIYIEVLELYKNDALENIKWTGSYEKLFAPESILISTLADYNINKIYTLEYPYQRQIASYPIYLIQKGETVLGIEFREQLDIGIWR